LDQLSVQLFAPAEGFALSARSLSCLDLAFRTQAVEEQALDHASSPHRIRVVLPWRELLLPLRGIMFSGTGVGEAIYRGGQSRG